MRMRTEEMTGVLATNAGIVKPPLGIKTIEGSMGRHRRGKRGIGPGVPK